VLTKKRKEYGRRGEIIIVESYLIVIIINHSESERELRASVGSANESEVRVQRLKAKKEEREQVSLEANVSPKKPFSLSHPHSCDNAAYMHTNDSLARRADACSHNPTWHSKRSVFFVQ